MPTKTTTDGRKGGNVGGKKHVEGGVKAVVVDTGKPVEIEKDEVIITAPAVRKHWKELSEINQDGGGVKIYHPDSLEKGGNADDKFYKKSADCKCVHADKKEFGGGFDDMINEFEEENKHAKKDETPSIVKETMALGEQLITTDYFEKIKHIALIKKFISGIEHMNLYKLGWRFQFGSSRAWAGLCDASPRQIGKSKNKNIYISIQTVKHDRNWKENATAIIKHEIAHAIVFEIFKQNQESKKNLHEIDDLDKATQGQGLVWNAVCKAIGGLCRLSYENADYKESHKKFTYDCPNCEHVGYGDYQKFTTECDNCGAGVIVHPNLT